MKNIISIKGTAGIAEWWITGTIANLILQFASLLGGFYWYSQEPLKMAAGAGLLLLAVLSLWISIAVTCKRLRDRGHPTWTILLGLIPIAGVLWLLIECGFLPSTAHRKNKVLTRRFVQAGKP